VRLSKVLTGNDLGLFGGFKEFPSLDAVEAVGEMSVIEEIINEHQNPEERLFHLHNFATVLIESGEIEEALKVVLFADTQ